LDYHGWGTPRDGLKYSCNDILCQISDYIDEKSFISRIRSLGFGQKTGIELPSETAGSVKDTTSRLWSARSKPTIAIGQEISVSALQMVQAATAIANGGVPVKLTVINKITNKDGTVFSVHKPEYKERVFSKSTADYVLSCMETTAKEGTGSRANIGDVSIGVKTGTAQMADKEKGGYSDTDFLSSCIAIFPVEEPQIILYIVVEKAKGETYGGRIVAPVIGETADIIIDHLGMSRGGAASLEHNGLITISKSEDISIGKTVPNFIGKSKKDLLPLLDRTDIQFTINGSGWVTSQTPEAGTEITENMTIELNLE
jgi:cell division protein FtsI (penicillin-binding protein 3)